MPIAIQDHLLTGDSPLEKFQHARALGVPGVEVRGEALTANVPEIVEAMEQTGVRVSAVNHGRQGNLLAPTYAEREQALVHLRQSIMNACDLGAGGVVFVPHFGAPLLPDLSPWMTAAELETEMFYTHLRTLEDFAYAMGIDLYVETVNHYETHLFHRLDQTAKVTRRMNHPSVQIAANIFHMALEEADLAAALQAHADCLGYVHLADSNHRLPGAGTTDFAAIVATLNVIGYHGWVTLESHSRDPSPSPANISASLAYLRQAGLS